jgi:hypothetical protein
VKAAPADSSRDRLTHRQLDLELLALAEVQREALNRADWAIAAATLRSSVLLQAIANLDECAMQANAELLLLPEWIESDAPSARRPPAGIVELAARSARINTYRGQN